MIRPSPRGRTHLTDGSASGELSGGSHDGGAGAKGLHDDRPVRVADGTRVEVTHRNSGASETGQHAVIRASIVGNPPGNDHTRGCFFFVLAVLGSECSLSRCASVRRGGSSRVTAAQRARAARDDLLARKRTRRSLFRATLPEVVTRSRVRPLPRLGGGCRLLSRSSSRCSSSPPTTTRST